MKRVFLVGFMCSGKTTVGRILSRRLSWEFVDLDTEIEKFEGMSIPEIFEKKGEAYFRRIELETLKGIASKDRVVVATGGGLGANPEAMRIMKERGLVVWIEIDFEEFMRRCGGDTSRPLLRMGEERLRDLLRTREAVYSQAHLKVRGIKGPEDIAEEVLSNLSGGPS